jgi:hypothetical protein
VRNRSRKILSILFSVLGAFFAVFFVMSSWVWTQALDTDTYVETASVAIDQVQIQSEIAVNIVDSVLGDAQVDDNIRGILEQGARLVVSSDEFHSFWAISNRSMHEILRNQFLSDDAALQNAQIDITPEVDQVLLNLRAIDPTLARLLPETAPETVIEIADQQTIDDLSSAINGLDRARQLSLIFAVAFLILSAILLGLRRRSLLAPSFALFAAGAVVYGLVGFTKFAAKRTIDSEFRDTASVIIDHMTSSLSSRVWQLVAIGILGLVVCFFPVRIFTNRNGSSLG